MRTDTPYSQVRSYFQIISHFRFLEHAGLTHYTNFTVLVDFLCFNIYERIFIFVISTDFIRCFYNFTNALSLLREKYVYYEY